MRIQNSRLLNSIRVFTQSDTFNSKLYYPYNMNMMGYVDPVTCDIYNDSFLFP